TAPSRMLSGRLEAHTSLKSQFRAPGAMGDEMQTQTKFTVHGAVVHGFDLAQAVKTVGTHGSGETRLDTLAGNVVTHGKSVQLNNLVATSGALSANGSIAMTPARQLSGKINVDLVAG